MKITYTAYTAVAEWKWDLPEEADDTCGICRVQFEGTCARCKFPGDECPIRKWIVSNALRSTRKSAENVANPSIVIGACRHCFHAHCINDWLRSESSQNKCPMCRQEFKEKIATAASPLNTQTGQAPPPQTPAAQNTPGP